MTTFSIKTKKGAALLERFSSCKVGSPCLLPSLFPALTGRAAQAVLVMANSKYWEFRMYWLGVDVGLVTASLHGDTLELEAM